MGINDGLSQGIGGIIPTAAPAKTQSILDRIVTLEQLVQQIQGIIENYGDRISRIESLIGI